MGGRTSRKQPLVENNLLSQYYFRKLTVRKSYQFIMMIARFFQRQVIQAACFALFFFSSGYLCGQNGWDHIRSNDYLKAQEEFSKVLEKDSINEDALKGMIFIAETSGNQRAYKKYINRLLEHHWNENYFLLFQQYYERNPEKLLTANTASERLKTEMKLHQADELYKKRKTAESHQIYKEIFGNYKWTFIGPFKNVNGSGHIVKFPVETDSYDTSRIYKDEDGLELKWVSPPYLNRRSMVSFQDHLDYTYSDQVYFANTFIEIPEKRKVELRITRESPIKIWIDHSLVYENNDNTTFEWDNEVLEVELSPGIHRVLVKVSGYHHKDYHRYANLENAFAAGLSKPGKKLNGSIKHEEDQNWKQTHFTGDFEIRFTDTQGKLWTDLKSHAMAASAPAICSSSFKGFFVTEYFLQKAAGEPEQLFHLYCLLKAFEKYKMESKGEETIIKYFRKNQDLVFAKYLAYSIYSDNGKREKAYEVLNDIDHRKTPIFVLLYEKLQEIDKVNDEEKYLAALSGLQKISPSNFRLIRRYIDYYDGKGMNEEKEVFVKDMIKKYPEYEHALKQELKKNLEEKKQQQKEMLMEEGNYSEKRNTKVLKKGIRKHYSPEDYFALINLYETRDEFEKAMALYEELQQAEPYKASYHFEKAEYLFEEEKYEQAIAELKKGLQLRPFDFRFYEMLGDIYHDKKEKDKALHYYKLAKKTAGRYASSYYSYRSGSTLKEKIEKIEGPKQLKKIFDTPGFQSILDKEPEWKEKYKDEESVVLMYTRDVVIDSNNHAEAFDKMMIKILKDAGILKWVEYDFSFLGEIRSAKVIKKNGAEVVPDGSGTYKVFKNLEPGDIIQLEGGFRFDVTDGIDDNNYFFTYLSFEAPTYYSKYEVAVPEGKKISYLHYKVEDNLQKSVEKGFEFYKWEYSNLPKIANEDATIDKMDYYSCIMLSTVSGWDKIASWYDRVTYRKLESNYEVKEILDSIIHPGMTDRQKVEKIYNYLTREIKYSFVPFLQSGYVPKDPGLTVCSRIGDCKDVATLMITMLREVGIESYYVLVKTNDFFHAKILPSIYFNHVIAGYYLDGKLHFSDMTTDFYPYYILPEMDANAWALVVKEGETDLFQLPKDNVDYEKNKGEFIVHAQIRPDRSADLSVKAVHRGITGGNIREKFSQSSIDEQKNYIMDMMGKGIFDNVELKDYRFSNMSDISDPLLSDYTFNIFNYCDRVSGMLVFRMPYMTPVTAHPAILSKTRYNSVNLKDIVNIAPSFQKLTITFPPGYELLEMPDNISVESNYGIYKVTFKKIRNGLYIEKFQAFQNAVIDVKEFQAFKKFYLEILDYDSSKIALKKN